MNFTDIVTRVLAKVKRPDKLEMIRTEVNAALVFFSSEHDYDADVYEFVRPVDAPALKSYDFIIPINSMPRFRKVDYIRIAGSRHYAEELASRKLSACTDLRDKWYRSGANLNVKLSEEAAALDISFYQYPPLLSDSSPDHWMLDGNWVAIMEHAASVVFNDIGDAASADRALRAAMMNAGIFKNDHIRSP